MPDAITNESTPRKKVVTRASTFTDAIKSVTIPAIVYYINTLDSQSSERDKGESIYLLIGDVSYKTINYY